MVRRRRGENLWRFPTMTEPPSPLLPSAQSLHVAGVPVELSATMTAKRAVAIARPTRLRNSMPHEQRIPESRSSPSASATFATSPPTGRGALARPAEFEMPTAPRSAALPREVVWSSGEAGGMGARRLVRIARDSNAAARSPAQVAKSGLASRAAMTLSSGFSQASCRPRAVKSSQ
jgi:hypothetical protein